MAMASSRRPGGVIASLLVAVAAAASCGGNAADDQAGAPSGVEPLTAALSVGNLYDYDVLPFAGETYTEAVPKTLDLADMARATLKTMTLDTDPAEDYRLWFITDWFHSPFRLTHEDEIEGDGGSQGKFVAPLIWNRMVSGALDYNLDLQRRIVDRYLRNVNDTFHSSGASTRTLEGFIVNYLRDGRPMWRTVVQQAINNWRSDLNDRGDWGYWNGGDDPGAGDFWAQDPWREEILILAYKHLGYAPALETVKKHVNYARRHSGFFDEQGHFLDNHDQQFHVHALYLQAFLNLAVLVGDKDLLGFVNRSYVWAKSPTIGSVPAIGFFPEFVARASNGNSEGCNLADMVTLAIDLSKAGAGDYWDDADRWVRNHFAEAQLTEPIAGKLEAWSNLHGDTSQDLRERWDSTERVSERSIGSFAGWPGVNEWRAPNERGIQQCCTGNGARAVYYVWNNTLTEQGRVLRVNLLLNRAAARADVYSHLPYVGKVEVRVKKVAADLRIRIPNWVSTSGLAVKVNGVARGLAWEGRYLKVDNAAPGDLVTVTFTLGESTVKQTVAGTAYTFTQRGSTVVGVTPKGVIAPIYDRSSQRSSPAPMVSVKRFVTAEADLMSRKASSWKLPVVRVTASGDDGAGHGPDKMLDGSEDEDSRWAVEGDGAWALFDLGRRYTVSYVNTAAFQGEERVQYFDVQVSLNGQTFTTVFHAGSTGTTDGLQAVDFDDVDARYVRLVGHGTSENQWNEFTEFEVFGTEPGAPVPPADLAARDPVASANGASAALTLDNHLDTRWSAAGDGQWIRYDLGSLVSIAEVDLAFYQGTSRIHAFDIEASADGQSWTLVMTAQSSGTTMALQPFDVPNIAARYVRIVGHRNSIDSTIGLTEVRIKGY
jgi:hypothetical protein